jgi:hypothetical protein
VPGVLGFGEHDFTLLAPLRLVWRFDVGLVGRLHRPLANALQHGRGIAAEEQDDERDCERAEATADQAAAADAHAAPVFDIRALPASFPAHGESSAKSRSGE